MAADGALHGTRAGHIVRAARSASAELRAPGPVSNARWRAPARPGLRPPPGTSHPGHPNSLARRTAGPGWSAARRVHDVHVDAAAQAAIVVGAVERQRQLVDAVQRPGRRAFDAVVHRHRRVLMHRVHAAAERAQELQQVRPRELRARARSGSAGGAGRRARAPAAWARGCLTHKKCPLVGGERGRRTVAAKPFSTRAKRAVHRPSKRPAPSASASAHAASVGASPCQITIQLRPRHNGVRPCRRAVRGTR